LCKRKAKIKKIKKIKTISKKINGEVSTGKKSTIFESIKEFLGINNKLLSHQGINQTKIEN